MVWVCGGARFRARVQKGAGGAGLSQEPTPAPRDEEWKVGGAQTPWAPPWSVTVSSQAASTFTLTLEARFWPSAREKSPLSLERLWVERLVGGGKGGGGNGLLQTGAPGVISVLAWPLSRMMNTDLKDFSELCEL